MYLSDTIPTRLLAKNVRMQYDCSKYQLFREKSCAAEKPQNLLRPGSAQVLTYNFLDARQGYLTDVSCPKNKIWVDFNPHVENASLNNKLYGRHFAW